MHDEKVKPSPSKENESPKTESIDDAVAIQRIKNDVAKRLLLSWLADDSGYDERVWQAVKNSMEENRLSLRARFDE